MYESVQGKKLKASRIMKIIIVLSETMKKNQNINIHNNDRVRLILMGYFTILVFSILLMIYKLQCEDLLNFCNCYKKFQKDI